MPNDQDLPEPMRRLKEAQELIRTRAERARQHLRSQREQNRETDLATARQDILSGRPAPVPGNGPPPKPLSKEDLEKKALAQVEKSYAIKFLAIDGWEHLRNGEAQERAARDMEAPPEERDAAKRERFDKWQQEQRDALREKHDRERENLAHRTITAREQKELQFQQQYGDEYRTAREQIRALDAYRNGGLVSRAMGKIQEMKGSRREIEERLQELDGIHDRMFTPVEQSEAFQFQNLGDRQRAEVLELDALIDRQAEQGYEIPSDRSPDYDADYGTDISQ